MTQLTLTIVGSAATLARVLSALDDAVEIASVDPHVEFEPLPQINAIIQPAMPNTVVNGQPQHFDAPAPMPIPTAAAPVPTGPVETDSTGLPWDERIHASTKTKTSAGKWTKRKGLADGVFEAVEAELRASHPLSAAPVAAPAEIAAPVPMVSVMPVATIAPESFVPPVPTPMPEPQMQVYNPAPPTEQPLMPVPVPVAPVAQPVPVPQSVPVAQTGGTFHDLMQLVGAKMPTGEMTTDYLIQTQNEINAALNLAMQSFTDMADKPHAVAYCYQIFQRDGKL